MYDRCLNRLQQILNSSLDSINNDLVSEEQKVSESMNKLKNIKCLDNLLDKDNQNKLISYNSIDFNKMIEFKNKLIIEF